MNKRHHSIGYNKSIKLKNLLIIASIILLLILIIVILGVTGNLTKLMGNSVTNYYCEDSTYVLEGDKCVKQIKGTYALLGDVNLNGKIDEDDLKLLKEYADLVFYHNEDSTTLSDLQIFAADVNEDQEVFYNDETILRHYLQDSIGSNGAYSSTIGVKRVCDIDYDLVKNECIKKDIKDALIKADNKKGNDSSSDSIKNNDVKTDDVNNNNVETSNLKKLTINFDGNGGRNSIKQQYTSIGANVKIKNNTFSKDGYIFTGWKVKNWNQYLCYINEEKTSVDYKYDRCENYYGYVILSDEQEINTDSIVPSPYNTYIDSITLVAQWKKGTTYNSNNNRISVTITDNIGEIIKDSQDYKSSDYEVSMQSQIQNGYSYGYGNVTITANIEKNNDKKYYYRWISYRYDNVYYQTSCQILDKDVLTTKLDTNFGSTKGRYIIYDDAKCQKELFKVDTKKYLVKKSLVGNETINRVDASINAVSAKTRNVQTGKYTVNNNVSNTIYFPNDTTITYKFKFDVYDTSKKFYYHLIVYVDSDRKKEVDECREIPKNGEITKDIRMYASDSSRTNDIYNYYKIINLSVYSDNKCQNFEYQAPGNLDKTVYDSGREIHFQTFDVKYYANGGKFDYSNTQYLTVKYLFNYNNPVFFRNNYILYKNGYELSGYKVKYSDGRYLCYSDKSKKNNARLAESECNKNGYVIYNPKSVLSRTTSIDKEELTFIAQWKKK